MTRKEQVIQYIDQVFTENCNKDRIIFDTIPFKCLHDYLESKGWVDDESESNGWQLDYWFYMYDPDHNHWCLKGSVYYSNNIELYKDTEC